jgi:hypothetical protein
MALADPFVNIPSGTRPATFETDSENYHNVQLPNKIQEIAQAALAMSLNSVIASSTTSMLIGTGAKTLTVQINKSFLAGMDIRVVDVAAPNTNYVNASVTSYTVGTGVLNFTVPSGQAFGSGTLTNWSVFQVPAGGATNTFVQQLVQNQSATAFTTGGTSSAFTLTPSPAISANAANQMFFVKLNAAPTGSPTLAVSGQPALGFKYYDSNGVKQFITSTVAPINWQSEVFNDGVDWVMMTTVPIATSKIQPLTASVSANALTITLNPTTLDFRSSTLTSGAVTTLSNATALSLTVPSTATLGTASGVQSRLIPVAINNAGVMELAVINLAGGVDLSETGVINTTAIAAASNSANVFYSTVSRTGVAYRVVGYIESTQATAGTWATAPSTIQGYGGQAMAALSSLGYGQTWQTFTSGTRVSATTYYNTTGRPITVKMTYANATGGNCQLTIAGLLVDTIAIASTVASRGTVTGIVPPNQSYSVSYTGFDTWAELR